MLGAAGAEPVFDIVEVVLGALGIGCNIITEMFRIQLGFDLQC